MERDGEETEGESVVRELEKRKTKKEFFFFFFFFTLLLALPELFFFYAILGLHAGLQ